MTETVEIIADRAKRRTGEIVRPREHIEATYRWPYGAAANKLLLAMIHQSGDRIADDVEHVARLTQVTRGLRHGARHETAELVRQIMETVMEIDNPNTRTTSLGPILEHADIEDGDALEVRWRFGRVFRQLVAESEACPKTRQARIPTQRLRAERFPVR